MSLAFNTVYIDKLVEVFQKAMKSKKTTAIMILFGNTQAKVKINRTLSYSAIQGDGLSPTLFTAYLEAALRHIPLCM